MRVLVACEFSGVVREAFRARGHDAWSCDLLETEIPGQHIVGDVLGVIGDGWDLMIAHPPCTHLAVSGARWWAAKDSDGRTAAAVELVRAALRFVAGIGGPSVWALENPTGRLARLVPEIGRPRLSFDPCDYGDAYTKRTHLWGRFNADLPRSPVEPERVCSQGSWVQRLGGKSERTKVLRSTTPPGFARAFWRANQ